MRTRRAGDLHHHVGPVPAGQPLHLLETGAEGGELVHADGVIRSELARLGQPRLDPIDDDDGGPHGLADGRGEQAKPAGTLDNEEVTNLQPRLIHRIDHLRNAAVGTGRNIVRNGIGNFVEVLIRLNKIMG